MTIRAVVFDWGGVLIDHPAPVLFTYCANYFGVPRETFVAASRTLADRFQKGLLSEDEFWEIVCSDLGVDHPTIPSLWEAAFQAAYVEKPEVFRLASVLKKNGYTIGLLSNTECPAMRFFQQQQYDMFDVLVFSCAEGTRKPEEHIYRIALSRLQTEPQETVFIDDAPEFIAGAASIGIKTILFKTYAQVKHDLLSYSVQVEN